MASKATRFWIGAKSLGRFIRVALSPFSKVSEWVQLFAIVGAAFGTAVGLGEDNVNTLLLLLAGALALVFRAGFRYYQKWGQATTPQIGFGEPELVRSRSSVKASYPTNDRGQSTTGGLAIADIPDSLMLVVPVRNLSAINSPQAIVASAVGSVRVEGDGKEIWRSADGLWLENPQPLSLAFGASLDPVRRRDILPNEEANNFCVAIARGQQAFGLDLFFVSRVSDGAREDQRLPLRQWLTAIVRVSGVGTVAAETRFDFYATGDASAPFKVGRMPDAPIQ